MRARKAWGDSRPWGRAYVARGAREGGADVHAGMCAIRNVCSTIGTTTYELQVLPICITGFLTCWASSANDFRVVEAHAY